VTLAVAALYTQKTIVAVLAAAICGFAAAAGPATAANFTWNGAAAAGEAKWSNPTNWGGGAAPSGAVETLNFPKLESPACTSSPRTATCYQSNNDVGGLSVNSILIDDNVGYSIKGGAIALGSGGITAGTSSGTVTGGFFTNPLALGAPQTWSFDGNKHYGAITFGGPVTGESEPLGIHLTHQGGMGLQGGHGFEGSMEVGAITISGENGLGIVALYGASMNGVDAKPVSLSQAEVGFFDTSSIGPLTLTHGQISTFVGHTGTLAVSGAITFDSASGFSPNINNEGTTAGVDYSQVSATGAVKLAGALEIQGHAQESGGFGVCPKLKMGDVDTLLTTTGVREGEFAGVPNEAVVTLNCNGGAGTPPKVRINYTPKAVTATVVTSGGPPPPATTKLETRPASPVTNQSVTLTSTVSAETPGVPFGTVAFRNHTVPIAGCENVPLSLSAPYTATCQTAFAAVASPEALTAVFTPTSGSELGGSTSPTESLTVGKDSTAVALGVSSGAPAIGASVTYTATVTAGHAGATEPSGPVQFLDGGVPVGSCAGQPLTQGASSSTASCTLSYATAGGHGITAGYLGDTNFTASTSAAKEVVAQPTPPPFNASPPTSSGVVQPAAPIVAKSQTVAALSGTVTVRRDGTATFGPLSGSTSIPNESEVDATRGWIGITVATAKGGTASAELYGGRFRVHQDRTGRTRFILTLALTGCPRVALPRGSAALLASRPRHPMGPTSRHLWVSETAGSWGTSGRFLSASAEGTRWLTLDECRWSQITVAAGKVKVRDLVRRKTKTVSSGKRYVAVA
jgi:Big-like domain-containing protein